MFNNTICLVFVRWTTGTIYNHRFPFLSYHGKCRMWFRLYEQVFSFSFCVFLFSSFYKKNASHSRKDLLYNADASNVASNVNGFLFFYSKISIHWLMISSRENCCNFSTHLNSSRVISVLLYLTSFIWKELELDVIYSIVKKGGNRSFNFKVWHDTRKLMKIRRSLYQVFSPYSVKLSTF